VAALPVCIAVAVLKYRLYAIDRIISRVISYVVITAVLGGIFAGLVILATQVFPVRTPVAVAAATLVAAALFNSPRRGPPGLRAFTSQSGSRRARTPSGPGRPAGPATRDLATRQAASGARGIPRRSRC
jgi:hypothetical protein